MITNRRFLFSFRIRATHNQDPAKRHPNWGKETIMIPWPGIILVFFGVKQKIVGYERREKERRRCGLLCDVLSCAVLSCAVNNKNLLFEGCDLPQWFHVFLHKSDDDMYMCTDIYIHIHIYR